MKLKLKKDFFMQQQRQHNSQHTQNFYEGYLARLKGKHFST